MNYSGNLMYLAHFQDFYYLQALKAGLTMAKSANPEMDFRHAVQRFENDLDSAMTELSSEMAKRIHAYLWYAALGEAEYASSQCETHIAELEDSYHFANYNPADNAQIVLETFQQDGWNSAYGGNAWAQIVEGLMMYGNIPDAAFIDHAADLEHNGGCVFDKGGTSKHGLEMHTTYNQRDFKNFLDYKFKADLLNDEPFYNPCKWVSFKTLQLFKRYSNIVQSINAVSFLQESKTNQWLSAYSILWGNDTLTVAESSRQERYNCTCDNCGNGMSDDHQHINSQCLCDRCYERMIEHYSTCEKCDALVRDEDTQYMQSINETWCDDCVHWYAKDCENCGETYSTNDMIDVEGDSYCEDCAKAHHCQECDEYFTDLDEHTNDEHKFIPEYVDADGVLTENYQPLATHWTVTYKWEGGTYEHTTQPTNNYKSVLNLWKGIQTAGAILVSTQMV